ncbi:MAG: radical SAM family heme chaperone HemW [Bacteroidales bacterium]|nr:radical SAM family heme chaperone HemW [Bacteroidales bacterium]
MSGIYIHIPFCRQKCIYCAFYSVALLSKKKDFLDALDCEIDQTLDYLPSRQIDTLYIGGGTPSLLSIRELENIITKIRRHYMLSPDFECTMEANPEQLQRTYLKDLVTIGINRLSIGVQSFNDDTLRFLGRKHNAVEAKDAVFAAKSAGFDNISIDLIYGISQRQAGEWERDLQQAIDLPISHLSCYALTKEENTLLWRQIRQNKLPDIDDDLAKDEFYQLLSKTREGGFEQYEISNFARNGQISRHNYSYWTREPYLGLGPSAHSYNRVSRKWNVSQLQQYIENVEKGIIANEYEELSTDDRYNEYVMLGLRTRDGINLQDLEQEFGTAFRQYAEEELGQINPSYYIQKDNTLLLTDEGKLFADGIAETLFR